MKLSKTQPVMEQVTSKCAGLIVVPPWYINNAVIIKYKKISSHAKCIQLPCARIEIEARQIFLCVLRILLRFHSHVENRAVSRGANHLTVQTALATLALCPQSTKPNLKVRHFGQCFRIQLAKTRAAVFADGPCHLFFARERLLAPHACLRLLRKLHETSQRWSCNRNGARVFPGKQLACFLFA